MVGEMTVTIDKKNRNIEAVWETSETEVDYDGTLMVTYDVLSVSHFGSSKAIAATYRKEKRGRSASGFSIRQFEPLSGERIMAVRCGRYSEKQLRDVFGQALELVIAKRAEEGKV